MAGTILYESKGGLHKPVSSCKSRVNGVKERAGEGEWFILLASLLFVKPKMRSNLKEGKRSGISFCPRVLESEEGE